MYLINHQVHGSRQRLPEKGVWKQMHWNNAASDENASLHKPSPTISSPYSGSQMLASSGLASRTARPQTTGLHTQGFWLTRPNHLHLKQIPKSRRCDRFSGHTLQTTAEVRFGLSEKRHCFYHLPEVFN